MTDHADLSKSLALALGYAPESVRVTESIVDVYRMSRNDLPFPFWYEFSYTDPTIYGPLLEWLMREHEVTLQRCLDNKRFGVFKQGFGWYWSDTLAEAVARACIAVTGGG